MLTRHKINDFFTNSFEERYLINTKKRNTTQLYDLSDDEDNYFEDEQNHLKKRSRLDLRSSSWQNKEANGSTQKKQKRDENKNEEPIEQDDILQLSNENHKLSLRENQNKGKSNGLFSGNNKINTENQQSSSSQSSQNSNRKKVQNEMNGITTTTTTTTTTSNTMTDESSDEESGEDLIVKDFMARDYNEKQERRVYLKLVERRELEIGQEFQTRKRKTHEQVAKEKEREDFLKWDILENFTISESMYKMA